MNDDEILRRQRIAIIEDFQLIHDSLAIIDAINREREGIDRNYDPFIDHLLISSEHLIGIKLWNLIAKKESSQHNLHKFVTNISKSIDAYSKQIWPQIISDEERNRKNQSIIKNIKILSTTLEGLIKDPLYTKINNWRDQVFAHFDDSQIIGRLYCDNGTISSKSFVQIREKWVSDNKLTFCQIGSVVDELFLTANRIGIGSVVESRDTMETVVKIVLGKLR
ncbi:hypothetical protein EG831_00800 [bacterium]|nr:hypothetical protein [bacterium]